MWRQFTLRLFTFTRIIYLLVSLYSTQMQVDGQNVVLSITNLPRGKSTIWLNCIGQTIWMSLPAIWRLCSVKWYKVILGVFFLPCFCRGSSSHKDPNCILCQDVNILKANLGIWPGFSVSANTYNIRQRAVLTITLLFPLKHSIITKENALLRSEGYTLSQNKAAKSCRASYPFTYTNLKVVLPCWLKGITPNFCPC